MVHGAEEEWSTSIYPRSTAINKVTIHNVGIGPSVDDLAEAFAGRSIYSIG